MTWLYLYNLYLHIPLLPLLPFAFQGLSLCLHQFCVLTHIGKRSIWVDSRCPSHHRFCNYSLDPVQFDLDWGYRCWLAIQTMYKGKSCKSHLITFLCLFDLLEENDWAVFGSPWLRFVFFPRAIVLLINCKFNPPYCQLHPKAWWNIPLVTSDVFYYIILCLGVFLLPDASDRNIVREGIYYSVFYIIMYAGLVEVWSGNSKFLMTFPLYSTFPV